ncbi:acidic phospholipase A2 Cc1-PLA2 [Octopus bimaculoides]|uniref:Phospholipase A2 n=1 Tax=Octopus bimaculoides TaxID=37653 RepID=A0A0L8IAV0_OCTBM|nr:acidic phospholipase A2 Cc1-PLA2 [Octopus bimaculoides]|eukprot:XP_014780833.1 PREDICTED: acidic phospholipase A2-like [Octopus bimaculoides]
MKNMNPLLCLMLVGLTFCAAGSHSIHKRSLPRFGKMVEFLTGKNSLMFNEYGRWCGFGGSGTPVDAIDRCCQKHDYCYDRVNEDQCNSWFINKGYITKYNWHFDGVNIICDDSRQCEQATCECDRDAAMCFQEHIDKYDKKHQSFLGKLFHKITG